MTVTRVTQNMLAGRSLSALQGSLSRLATTQEQLSTGKVINRASDSPTDATSSMRMRVAIADQKGYVRNADNGLGWLGAVDSTLSGMNDSVRRARDLGLQGVSTGTTSSSARAALAVEVDQLRESLMSDANTTYLGRPIFGGDTSGKQAFDPMTGAFVGTTGQVTRTVADGVQVRVDITGTDVVGPDGASLFDDLTALSDALTSNDAAGMRTALASLEGRMTTINAARASSGAAYNRVEAASQQGQDQILSMTGALSQLENTDLPKAMVDLQLQEVAYQAALAATARVMQPSLIDFLR